MRTEPDVMPYDSTLLSEIAQQHPTFSVKALAFRSGRDISTIYRYLAGEKTIPSDVLRSAFELTLDIRLVGLIAGGVPLKIEALTPPEPGAASGIHPLPAVAEMLPRACESAKKAVAGVEYISKIVADGRVAKSDAADIEKFRETAAQCQRDLALLTAALAAHIKKG